MKIDARFQKMFTDKRFHTKCIYNLPFFLLLKRQSLEFNIYTSGYCCERYIRQFWAFKDIFFSSYLNFTYKNMKKHLYDAVEKITGRDIFV